jgi:hypothetical protein
MKERFSKASVAAEIQRRIDAIQAHWRFDPGNGTAQLRGKDNDAAVAYGEWSALRSLAAELELMVEPRNPRWKP